MNKLIAIVLSSLLLTSAALADHHAGGKHGDKYKNMLGRKLELTEEQKQPVADILKEQRAKGREIRHSAFEQIRPQMEALHEETKERLAGVLTEEQLQKYDKMSSRKHKRMEKRFSHK